MSGFDKRNGIKAESCIDIGLFFTGFFKIIDGAVRGAVSRGSGVLIIFKWVTQFFVRFMFYFLNSQRLKKLIQKVNID